MRWVLAAAPELAKRLGTLRAWSDAPWIGWGERLSSSWPARWVTARLPEGDPVVRSDSFMLQRRARRLRARRGAHPRTERGALRSRPAEARPALREAASDWPIAELFLVTHRALRQVPRVSVVWDLIVARMAARKFS